MNHAIYPADHAARLQHRAGQPWRPSNGVEGDLFAERVCLGCQRCGPDHMGCDITLEAMMARIGDPGYPTQWRIGPDGQPMCTDFLDIAAEAT